MLQHGDIHSAIPLRHSDAFAKVPNRFRGIAATAKARQRRHSRIIPSTDMTLLHQLQELSFAERCITKIEAGEFNLLWMVDGQLLEKPVIQRPVILKF